MSELVISSIGFALFILCPRMAGMANVIANSTNVNLIWVSVLGTVMALPLIVVMVIIFKHFGLWGAMAFAILTDVGAALMMGAISWKSSFETIIIALFVIGGVKVAGLISTRIFS